MIEQMIYTERLRISKVRQRTFEKHIDILDDILKRYTALRENNPYDNYPEQTFCDKVTEYARGAHWIGAGDITHTEYMYRIDKYPAIIKYNPINTSSFFGNLYRDANSIKTDFDFIVKSFIDNKLNWFPLSDIITEYSPKRNFSWWTNEQLSNIISDEYRLIMKNLFMIHSCGIANDWIKERSIIMRCKLNNNLKKSSIKVPSVIDAYSQPIFNPSREDESPTHGKAILLSETLSLGYNEYVLKDISINNIDFKPLKINEENIYLEYPEVCLNEIYVKLVNFHQNAVI